MSAQTPPLPPLDAAAFERAMVLSLERMGNLSAEPLARWTCASLGAMPPEERRGSLYVQLGIPTGADALPFQGNVFLPSGSMTLLFTGTPSLVNAVAVGVMERAGRYARGGRRWDYRLPSLPLYLLAQDDSIQLGKTGYFAPFADRLRQAGWSVSPVEPEDFAAFQKLGAELLHQLSEQVPRPAKKKKSAASTFKSKFVGRKKVSRY